MSANNKAKLKLLYLRRMLEEETDSEHGLSMSDILQRLAAEGVNAERKSIYRDLDILREFGMDIQTYQRNPVEYGIEHREFNINDLMLMADAVASCKALTKRQENTLLGNIKSLASASEQKKLDRHIHVPGRIHKKDQSVFPAINAIHDAMQRKVKVQFKYAHYGLDGQPVLSNGGEAYVVTPLQITYSDCFYYLTAWDDELQKRREFRLDRMDNVKPSAEAATRNKDIAEPEREETKAAVFGRYHGEVKKVKLKLHQADKVEILVDRFDGLAEIQTDPDGTTASAWVPVEISPQFFGWIAGLNDVITIEEPKDVCAEYKSFLESLLKACK